ncbi:two-component system CheB/CheR fusion protein [Sphingomonas sp. BE138]|uniref:CheR family methyltransferase n=1 Tax=Sphingomonas sp. BE138 TaxID=2817845 RepID=UPI00285E481E|nr:CheR family methyltransferase [Sphingomonas sp. BE138]MDR6786690.1 two-component system CheB/CheR fusion protein [Sphingomonas sp. BE138]
MHSSGAPRTPAPARPASVAVPVVGIGASAGGLEALREMLAPARMPTGLAFVVVQHLDPHHESMLAQLLDRATSLEVLQCAGGERIGADTVYIIPPGRGLAIRDGVLELTDFQQPRGLRRPIDDFFLSLASDQQSNAACVILSGTGADGTTGLRAIKENGGVGVVQQPESARYDGMPLSAVGTGLIDFVKPAGEILECLQGFFQRRNTDPREREAGVVADHVDELCRVLRTAIGHDFSGYKRSTLIRRVERRMHVLGIDTGRAYLARIKSDSDECEALFRDLLINVTRFFRDPEAFETLRTRVIEPLLRERATDDELRIWVPGCSSGEEAYTIAMLFAEAARTTGAPLAVQIFATDIDEQMLTIARAGSYPNAALMDLPAGLRERYVVPHADRFTIAASIRDMIRFSNHSLVKDPPFSRVDLVSCRNLLIYFDDRLQRSVVPLFHYALRPGGYLFLGPSESVGRFEQLFTPVDQHARLYERAPGAPSYPIDLPGNTIPSTARRGRDPGSRDGPALANESVAIRRIVERYAPASLIVDQDGAILSAYGKLSRYFEFPVTRAGGSSAVNLARAGLRTVIGPLLRQARDERRRVVARDVEVETDYGIQPVEVICDPLGDGTLLFVFRDSGAFRPSDQDELEDLAATDDHLEAIEDELRLTRHRLRTAIEELETANEELKSSNEEMMSMNEELQSTNEELSTVNDELKSKVEQLTVAIADLRNFHQSTELAVVVLDAELHVRSYTEAAVSIFPLQPGDRGRPLSDVASRLRGTEYLDDARAVAAGGAATQRRVTTSDGARVLSLRVLPYRTQTGKVDGTTLVLTDITEALSLERQLAAERERLDLAIKAAGIGVWEYCPETGETVLDPVERELFGVAGTEAARIDPLLDRIEPGDRGTVETALRRAVERNGDFEATFRVVAGDTTRWIKGFGRVIAGSHPPRLLGVSIDVTPEYTLADTRDLMLREMNHRVKNLFAVIAGMITVAARNHQEVRAFAGDLRRRIAALGSAHSLASPAGQPQAIGLAALVDATLAPYRDHSRITIEGPVVALERNCLSSLALVLHEWATNSVKYGALHGEAEAAEAEGTGLSVRWRTDADGLELVWEETGRDDQAATPTQRGFGSLLVETSVRQMRGEVGSEAAGRSFRLRMKLPTSVLACD